MDLPDPVYVEISEVHGRYLKLNILLFTGITTVITLQRVSLDDMRRFVDSFYKDERVKLVGYGIAGMSSINYDLDYI